MSESRKLQPAIPGFLFRHRITRHIVVWSTLIYAFLYLWAIGDISLHGWRSTLSLMWVREPMDMLFQQRNLFYFEGIAIIDLPLATYLFSPVNLLIALLLAVLVGLNLALSYLSVKYPVACRGRPTGTLLASVPALLAGTTCSIPVVLVVLGIQTSAAVLAVFSAMVPIALILLTAALVFNAKRTNPAEIDRPGRKDSSNSRSSAGQRTSQTKK
jgi:hypothetical protein